MVKGLGVSGLGFSPEDSEFMVQNLVLRLQGAGSRVQGVSSRMEGVGFGTSLRARQLASGRSAAVQNSPARQGPR